MAEQNGAISRRDMNLIILISVAWTDINDNLGDHSSTAGGGSNYHVEMVDLGAPGEAVYSTVLNNLYDYACGTSMAAPLVAGTAALIYSLNPDITYSQVKEATSRESAS